MTAFITADDLRAYVTNGKAADENRLQMAVDSACGTVEDGYEDDAGNLIPGCGPILLTSRTESVDAGRAAVLDYRANEITAVTVGAVADYKVKGQVLSRVDKGYLSDMEVTYTTGYDEAPAWARDAALIIASHNWKATLSLPGQGVPTGFDVPKRAASKMAPHRLAPLGFA